MDRTAGIQINRQKQRYYSGCMFMRVWLNKRDKVLAALEPSEYGPKGIGIFANVLVEGIYLKINLELNNSAIHWF